MKSNLTIVIANYMRSDNVDMIAREIPDDARLFIVDNSPDGSLGKFAERRADWVLRSCKNNLTTRWYMAQQADTPYYCVHDDDLYLQRYGDYVANTKVLTGPFGVQLHPDKSYIDCSHSNLHNDEVDMIKGRIVFGETSYLNSIPMPPRWLDGYYETIISEDIYISSKLPGPYKITNYNDIIELPAPHASSKTAYHYDRREVARRRCFNK